MRIPGLLPAPGRQPPQPPWVCWHSWHQLPWEHLCGRRQTVETQTVETQTVEISERPYLAGRGANLAGRMITVRPHLEHSADGCLRMLIAGHPPFIIFARKGDTSRDG